MNARFSRRRILRLAVWETGRACRSAWARAFGRFSPGKAVPTRLLFAPQDLRTGDPTIANDIYSGFFAFAGRAVTTSGRTPFEYVPPSEAWGEALYSFGWLRHLRAANTALAQANARALVDDFLVLASELPAVAERADIKAHRLIAFICHAPLLLEGADHGFYHRFLKTVGRMTRDLESAVRPGQNARFRLMAAIASCYAGLCTEGLETSLARMMRVLLKELDEQILPDGGHVSRNPGLLVDYLFYLLPLRQIFASRGYQPPPALANAIDRMIPMIRMLRHGDSNMARFNGMAATEADHLATLLLYDEARARPILHAPYSGYERIEAGQTLIIADTGRAPPQVYSTEVAAGTLSFELSHGADAIVVNCGSPRSGRPEVRQAARTTAAHSTASVDHASTMTFLDAPQRGLMGWLSHWLIGQLGVVVLEGPSNVQSERGEWNNGTLLNASHDGFQSAFGIIHERRLFLSDDGQRLNGEDVFQGPAGSHAATLRFHLAPEVRANSVTENGSILLTLPSGDIWQVDATPPARIDDSMFFASNFGAQKSLQLVISFALSDATVARWQFSRLDAAKGAPEPMQPTT